MEYLMSAFDSLSASVAFTVNISMLAFPVSSENKHLKINISGDDFSCDANLEAMSDMRIAGMMDSCR